MEYIRFQETIGVYEDNSNTIDSTVQSIYKLKRLDSESDGYSNQNGWQKELPGSNEFNPIRQIIVKNFSDYFSCYNTDTSGLSFGFTKFFCNVNPPNAYNFMHDHEVGEFSGTFYLVAKKRCGDLIIMSPFPNRFLNTSVNLNESFNSKRITPKRGLGTFFNSNLIHYADVNRSDSDRISISFHIKLLNN